MKLKRVGLMTLLVMTMAVVPGQAFAGGEPPPESAKCNAGRGNLSETTPATDCDPGNSGGRNQGGD